MSCADTEPAVSGRPTRRSIRTASAKGGQQRRREEALQRQQAARQDFADHARQLVTLAAGSLVQPASDDQANPLAAFAMPAHEGQPARR